MLNWDALARRLETLARGARPGDLVSLTVPLAALPEGLPAAGDWFRWQRPDAGLTLTGVGRALGLETAGPGRFAALGAAVQGLRAGWRIDAGGPPPLTFAGFAFSPAARGPLPNACLAVPALLLRRDAAGAWAVFSCAAAEAHRAPRLWQSLWHGLASAPGAAAPRLSRLPAPLADLAFLARGRAALGAIAAGAFDKLVLTRGVRLRADRPFAPETVLAALAAHNPSCAVWAAGRDGRVFLGASPETLLARAGDQVEVDALAGTAWTGTAGDAPPSLPLAGAKNRREHDQVADSIAEALAPLCEAVHVPAAPEVMRLRDLRHLRRRIRATVRAGAEAFDLIARLHPTPAVGGTPTAAALDWLAAHGDRRGAWYTGGIGWVDAAGNADFAVALRCGLLAGREATLFAGAGFVAGSDPRQELAETEAKLAPMLRALRAGPAAAAEAA
jgi:isochorismate synthase